MWEITAVISGFLLAIGTILVVTGANIPLGLGLMAVGAVGLAASVMANWNGMSERLAKVLTIVTGVLGGFLLEFYLELRWYFGICRYLAFQIRLDFY
ncbi:hypothetical protein [Dorea formicigenerans]|uniref:hypothetical protein n=1 Tax=Dorea formicigenerans TaxID=39486 RepID=UPI00164EC4F8|nr:hypothetical protein [Dorea formicigenerans]